MNHQSRSRRTWALVLAAALVSSVTPTLAASATAQTTLDVGKAVGQSAAVGAGSPRVPKIRWSACDDTPGFDCARIKVPLDYDTPRDGRTVTLAVVRHRAEGPGRRLGTTFFNPGGPGGKGTTDLPAFLDYFPAEVRQRFDLVSWDPRGVGQSTAAQCFDTDQEGLRFFKGVPSPSPVGRAQIRRYLSAYSKFGAVCRQRQRELLRHTSTANTARDLDLLRRAVGERVMNYIGVSYGTFLGATYANMFPTKVRTLVLDGNVAPSAWTNHGRRSARFTSTLYRVGSHRGQAATFTRFLRLCVQAGRERCAFAAPTLRQTQAKWRQLLRRTKAAPIPYKGKPVGYQALVSDVGNELFATRPGPVGPGWTTLAQILQTLYDGGSSGTPQPPTYGTPEEEASVTCGDSPNPRRRWQYPVVAAKARAEAGVFGPWNIYSDAQCINWRQQEDTYRGPWNRWTRRPVLVIGNLFDPSTPYINSVKMSRELRRARLLTVQGYGHTWLLNPSRCASERVAAYLVRGALPPAGTRCRQDNQPFDPVR